MTNFASFKKFFIVSLIGSLIVSALVAVVTVLVGEFNEVTARVFATLFMVVIHSLVSLGFVWNDQRENIFERLSFFINVVFALIVVSFLTSLFGIWKVIPGDMVWHLYQTYFVIAFASLHGNILSKASGKEKYMDMVIYANYIFIILVALMLMPIIYLDNLKEYFGEMFYRVLGAIAIINGTLSVLTAIFYRLFSNKHPEIENPLQVQIPEGKEKRLSIWVWLLLAYLVLQIVLPMSFRLYESFFR